MARKDWLILLLAWTSGCLDALSFLALGHVFVANMTGNTVLFGLAIAQGNWSAMLHSLCAMLGFSLGAVLSALLLERNYERSKGKWTPRVVVSLAIEGCLLLLFAIAWPLTKALSQENLLVYALIAVSGLAMGQQSATVVSLDIPGISTTYITGTITTLMTSFGRRLFIRTQEPPALANAVDAQIEQQKPARLAAVWLTYIIAAIVSGLAALHLAWLAPLLPLAAIVVVIAGARKQE